MVARILLSSSLIFSTLLTTFAQQPTPPPVPKLQTQKDRSAARSSQSLHDL
jgi:hypothetical protein